VCARARCCCHYARHLWLSVPAAHIRFCPCRFVRAAQWLCDAVSARLLGLLLTVDFRMIPPPLPYTPSQKHVAEKRNFTTQPSKKGTGYGYAAVTLSALPEYKTSPYKNEVALAKKAAVVAKKKRMAGALKLNAPAIGGTFSKDKTIFGPPAKTPRTCTHLRASCPKDQAFQGTLFA
jgi:hypothetical protein